MKYILVVVALLTITTISIAVDDPGAQYVDAFLLIQEGDAAKAASDWKAAYTKFSAAQNILLGIRDKSPSWNPHLVQFRLDYCAEQIDQIKPHLATTAPGLSATFVAPPKRGAESAEVRQLRAELAEALKQIDTLKRELQAAKAIAPPEAAELDRLRAELASARAEVERARAAHLNIQAVLNKKEAEEAARMAELNQKIADLQKELAERNRKLEELDKLRTEAADATARAEKLSQQNKQLAAQLAEARVAAERAQQTAIELEEARKTNARLQSELTEAKRAPVTGGDVEKLRAELSETRAAAERERKQHAIALEQLRKENRTLAMQLAEARRASTTATIASTELEMLRKELAAARAETERVKAESAAQIQALRRDQQTARTSTSQDESPDRRTATFPKGIIYAKTPATPVADETLQRQNRELSEQLAATTRELEKLRAKLTADARAHNAQRRKLADELSALQQQNRELARELADLKQAAEGNRGVIYRAPSQTSRSETADRLQKENERLATQLSDAKRQIALLWQQLSSKEKQLGAATATDADKRELEYQLRRLREENALLRQLLNRYASRHPELKREAQGHAITLTPRKQ